MLEGLCVGFEEFAELGCYLILLDGSEVFERAGESIFERPDIPCVERFVAGSYKVFAVDGLEKLDRESLGHESTVNHALRFLVSELVGALEINRLAERLPASLNSVNAHRNRLDQIKVFGVLGEERFEISTERHIVADEDSVTGDHAKPHTLVVGVSESDAEPDILVLAVEFK